MEETNEKRNWIIYMYTFPNDKKYIGKTSKTLQERQKTGWVGYEECPAVFSAINYYKPENIKQEILIEDVITDDMANELERYYIALYKTNCNRYRNPEYGYNLTDGGDGSCGPRLNSRGDKNHNSKSVYCIELNMYYSNAEEASNDLEISACQIRACCRGEQNICKKDKSIKNGLHWIWAKDVCEEKIQEVMSIDVCSHLYKPVYCIELNKYFKNIQSAENELNISGISRAINTIGKTAGKHPESGDPLHWILSSEVTEENIQKAICVPKTIHRGVEVYCIDLNLAFVSMSIPCKSFGISTRTLVKCINKERDSAGINPYNGDPLHWMLLSEYENKDNVDVLSEYDIEKYDKKIYCVEIDMKFNNTRDAAKYIHTSRSTLRECLRGDRETVGKHPITREPLHWKYIYNKSYVGQTENEGEDI